MLSVFLLILIRAATAIAAPDNVSISVASTQTCVTKYTLSGAHSLRLPTATATSSQTVHSSITAYGASSFTTTTVTPAAITATSFVDSSDGLLSTAQPSVIWVTVSEEAGQGCAAITTISAGVSTTYTGSYNGTTVARRTAGPLDRPYPIPNHHHLPWDVSANAMHVFGQSALNEHYQAFAVVCRAQLTTYYLTTITSTAELATTTVTASAPTILVTKADNGLPTPVPITSTMNATIPGTSNIAEACTMTAASSTTTQHLKCAPTNLVSEVNGYGIYRVAGDPDSTIGLAPGSDSSACCQLCVDDSTCAASEDDPNGGNCFLYYTTPSCGLGLMYSDDGQKLKPGAALIVQTGCGTMEATSQLDQA